MGLDMLQPLANLIVSPDPIPLMLGTTAFFLMIYVGVASMVWLLAKRIHRPLEKRSIKATQVRFEMRNALRSIVIFGAGVIVPWGLLQWGVVDIDLQAGATGIVIDCLLLVIWNELHFYAMHRLLHEKFGRLHAAHHKSVVSTPFSAYSMSATEAAMLGSVMPLAMLMHDFSLPALVFLPVWSICLNALAHSNCDLFPWAGERSLFNFIRHHQCHHSHYHGNYSFMFSQLDRWFGTSYPLNP